MSEDDPYRDPREGQRIHAERLREEQEERARFAKTLRPAASRRRIMLLLLLVTGLTAGLFTYAIRGTDVVVPATSPSASARARMPPLECVQLLTDYHALLDKARVCTRDLDCEAQPRGQLMTGLDGCARFTTSSKDLLAADWHAAKWQAGGCAGSYRTCPAPRGAICEEHLCVEKPPPEVPRSWHRLELPGLYSFFAPGDVVDIGLGNLEPEDSWLTRFGGHGMTLSFDVYSFGPQMEPEGGVPPGYTDQTIVRTEQLLLGGAQARLEITTAPLADAGGPFDFRVAAPHVPCLSAGPNAYFCRPWVSVSINSGCATMADCEQLMKVLRTFEPW